MIGRYQVEDGKDDSPCSASTSRNLDHVRSLTLQIQHLTTRADAEYPSGAESSTAIVARRRDDNHRLHNSPPDVVGYVVNNFESDGSD